MLDKLDVQVDKHMPCPLSILDQETGMTLLTSTSAKGLYQVFNRSTHLTRREKGIRVLRQCHDAAKLLLTEARDKLKKRYAEAYACTNKVRMKAFCEVADVARPEVANLEQFMSSLRSLSKHAKKTSFTFVRNLECGRVISLW